MRKKEYLEKLNKNNAEINKNKTKFLQSILLTEKDQEKNTEKLTSTNNKIHDIQNLFSIKDEKGIKIKEEEINNTLQILKSINYQDVTNFAMAGLNNREIAKVINIEYWIFKAFAVKYPPLEDALTLGRTYAIGNVVNAAYKRALGYTVKLRKTQSYRGKLTETWEESHIPADSKTIALILKNRLPDKWNNDNNLTLKGDKNNPLEMHHRPIDLSGFNDAQLAEFEEIGLQISEGDKG